MDKSLPDTRLEQQLADLKQKIVSYEKSNQFFEMLVRSLPGLFYLFDSNFNVLKWNRNMELVTLKLLSKR